MKKIIRKYHTLPSSRGTCRLRQLVWKLLRDKQVRIDTADVCVDGLAADNDFSATFFWIFDYTLGDEITLDNVEMTSPFVRHIFVMDRTAPTQRRALWCASMARFLGALFFGVCVGADLDVDSN